jgi:hypothetical protein
MATATRTGGQVTFRSADELREVLDRVLARVDRDEVAGPLLRATEMRLRMSCPDLDVAVNIAASDGPESCIEWSFSEQPPWKPKLVLTMSSVIANEYLQGKTSVPVAIARGQIQCSGDSRATLRYLPAAKLISGPYAELITSEYPHLVRE